MQIDHTCFQSVMVDERFTINSEEILKFSSGLNTH